MLMRKVPMAWPRWNGATSGSRLTTSVLSLAPLPEGTAITMGWGRPMRTTDERPFQTAGETTA